MAGGRGFALGVLLLAILLRIAIPAGWMPAGDGRHLQPCPGTAMLAMTAMAHGAQADHHRTSDPAARHGEACAFAAFALPLLTPDDPWTVPAFIVAIAALTAGFALLPVARSTLAAPPPPQTGPPFVL